MSRVIANLAKLAAVSLSLYVVYIMLRDAVRTPPDEERSLVLGTDEYGHPIVCDDPDCDIEGSLAYWQEQSILSRHIN